MIHYFFKNLKIFDAANFLIGGLLLFGENADGILLQAQIPYPPILSLKPCMAGASTSSGDLFLRLPPSFFTNIFFLLPSCRILIIILLIIICTLFWNIQDIDSCNLFTA